MAQICRHAVDGTFQGFKHRPVLLRTGQDRNIGMVFGRGTNHRWPSDIDFFNRLLPGDIRPRNGVLKRVEVHHHQIDRLNSLRVQVTLMRGIITPGKDSPMHPRRQGFHATTKDFRRAGVVRNPDHRQTRFLENRGGATTGKQLVTVPMMQGLR